ncbi:MAG: hypothetical protein RMK29_20150 [Myxococcales bacterium]|nr:hypothetical protein [Myxococcota bacterium]MDW8284023.1 hypothetical protein [Myxococcales bacterium]
MIPPERQQGYLAQQVGTLALSHVQSEAPMARVRAAAWHNTLARLGVPLPLFLVHDVGLLLTMPRSSEPRIGPREEVLAELRLAREVRGHLQQYEALLRAIAASEVVTRISGWRLRDELVAVLLLRVLGDVFHRFPDPARRVVVGELPLDPRLYEEADLVRHFTDFPREGLLSFLRFLVSPPQSLSVQTALEQIDPDTVRLLSIFTPLGQHVEEGLLEAGLHPGVAGGQLDLVDLYAVFQSTESNDVASFSWDLLPSVLETRRATGVQTFSTDGYASIERRGNLDSMVLSELAYEDELFELKFAEGELYYYGHEKQRDEERRLQYVLVDASPSMRGLRQVFARGLALTLCKKLALAGEEVWLRLFAARLSDLVRVSRTGADYATPYLLCYRSDRGRNYSRVFRQLLVELQRLHREERRQIVVYIITHGQCHLPREVVQALARVAYLYGVFILPSTEVELDYLDVLHRHQIVNEAILLSRQERRDRALEIVSDAAALQNRLRTAGR